MAEIVNNPFPISLILLRVLPVFLILSCQSVPTEKPARDWANVTLMSTGFGAIEKNWSIADRVQAIQRAKADIYTQLESQIVALKTDSGKKVVELLEKDETMHLKIAAFVRGAKIVRTETGDKGLKIVAELFLGEGFKATIGLAKKKQKSLPGPQRGNNIPR